MAYHRTPEPPQESRRLHALSGGRDEPLHRIGLADVLTPVSVAPPWLTGKVDDYRPQKTVVSETAGGHGGFHDEGFARDVSGEPLDRREQAGSLVRAMTRTTRSGATAVSGGVGAPSSEVSARTRYHRTAVCSCVSSTAPNAVKRSGLGLREA